MYYGEASSVFDTVSIIISMMNVCNMLFILNHTRLDTRDWTLKIFFWLCSVMDYFTIFFGITFAFYASSQVDLSGLGIFLQNWYLWSWIVCVFPMTFIFAMCEGPSLRDNKIRWFLFTMLLLLLFLPLFTLAHTIWHFFFYFPFGGGMGSVRRLPNDKVLRMFFQEIFDWILNESVDLKSANGMDVLFSKEQDKLLKVCVCNKVIMESVRIVRDPKLTDFLQNTNLENVKWKDLRNYTEQHETAENQSEDSHNQRNAQFGRSFFYHSYGVGYLELRSQNELDCIGKFWLTVYGSHVFVCGPLYVISKYMNFTIIPISISIYLIWNGGFAILWTLDAFVVFIWLMTIVICVTWWTFFVMGMRREFYLWHTDFS